MSIITDDLKARGMLCHFRCWRCGELPNKCRKNGKRGLSCACRGYTVSLSWWWEHCATRLPSQQIEPNEEDNKRRAQLAGDWSTPTNLVFPELYTNNS